jgi:hypothetical protein
MKTITGADIQVGDVIRSAAMWQPMRVRYLGASSTGRTQEVTVEYERRYGTYTMDYRVGMRSKVRLYEREGVAT